MTKAWQVFGVGLLVLALSLALVTTASLFYIILAVLSFSCFTCGFLFHPKEEILGLFLPDFTDPERLPVFDGETIGEPYPQVFIYKLDLKNIPLLFVLASTPMYFLIWMYVRHSNGIDSDYLMNYMISPVPYYCVLIIFMPLWTWLQERWLLRNAIPFWAELDRPVLTETTTRYVFRDSEGELRGGTINSRLSSPNRLDNVCIVLVDLADVEKRQPTFALWFHKLVLIDRRHASITKPDKP